MSYIDACIERSKDCGMIDGRIPNRPTSASFVDSIFEANDVLQEAIEKMCEEKTILPDAVRARIGRASNLLATYCLLNLQSVKNETKEGRRVIMMECMLCGKTFNDAWVASVSEGRAPNTPYRWRKVGSVCEQCKPAWNRIEPKIKKWE